MLAGVARLREQGFRIAVDDFVGLESQISLLPLADHVRIDLRGVRDRGRRLLDVARSHGGILIAERVESAADWDLGRRSPPHSPVGQRRSGHRANRYPDRR